MSPEQTHLLQRRASFAKGVPERTRCLFSGRGSVPRGESFSLLEPHPSGAVGIRRSVLPLGLRALD